MEVARLPMGSPAQALQVTPLARVCPSQSMQIDKLSMDKVTVFPDGELNVDAVASVPGTAAFQRPISAAWMKYLALFIGHTVATSPRPFLARSECTACTMLDHL
eukprot:1153287-Pelagomonas_calceolata.AAC.4